MGLIAVSKMAVRELSNLLKGTKLILCRTSDLETDYVHLMVVFAQTLPKS